MVIRCGCILIFIVMSSLVSCVPVSESELGEKRQVVPAPTPRVERPVPTRDYPEDCSSDADIPPVDSFIAVQWEPEMIFTPRLEYPESAKAKKQEGKVMIRSLVCESGFVGKAEILRSSGFPLLDSAAIQQARECEYEPAIKDREPVKVWVSYAVDFKLDRGGSSNGEEDYIPNTDEFVAVEVEPERTYEAPLELPKEADTLRVNVTAYVQALVTENGRVSDARIGKTSGYPILDSAAVKQAYLHRYNPAIQQGRPIKIWVSYRVNFDLK